MSKKSTPTFEIGKHLDPSFEGLSKNELILALEAVAIKVNEGSYTKQLNQNELGIAKSELADTSILISKIEEEKKEAMEEFKDKLKQPKAMHKELLEMIKTKSVRKDGLLYLVDDQERQLIYSFDQEAICVDVRPMSIQERQMAINSGNAVRNLNGTDDNK